MSEDTGGELAMGFASSSLPSGNQASKGHRWTAETAREARSLRGSRLQRQGPNDADIEAGLRKRAKDDPRAAEVLLRWLSRPRQDDVDEGLDGFSRVELERLHERLGQLCAMEESAFARLVEGKEGI